MPTAEALILERAELDLEEGLAHAKHLIRARHPNPFVARPMEAGLVGAVATLHLRTRFREDVRFLLSLARRVAQGEDASKLAEEHLARAIHLRELALLVREKDVAFAPILDVARTNFAARLPDLGRMAVIDDAPDYPTLVRRAFPDRKEVEAVLDANERFALGVVEHVERYPHLLRVPQAWVPRLGDVARDFIAWQAGRVRKSVDAIYG